MAGHALPLSRQFLPLRIICQCCIVFGLEYLEDELPFDFGGGVAVARVPNVNVEALQIRMLGASFRGDALEALATYHDLAVCV